MVGESHYQEALARVVGGHQRNGVQYPCVAVLEPEPNNPYDSEAVVVKVGGATVGYLSRGDARAHRALVDKTITTSGAASVHARIVGGWDRGAHDVGSFGCELYFAEETRRDPVEEQRRQAMMYPSPDEIRLRGSATLSVSNEEHYQAALLAATRGADLSTYTYPVVAELVEIATSPHAKKDSGPVLEVRVDDATVGHLTPAMSTRLSRMTGRARSEHKRLTCSASIFQGAKSGQPILEIRLSACPHAQDETVVVDPYFEIVIDSVRNRRTGALHRIREQLADGSYRTACGTTVAAADAALVASTKPWVADVDPITHQIVEGETRCQRC